MDMSWCTTFFGTRCRSQASLSRFHQT